MMIKYLILLIFSTTLLSCAQMRQRYHTVRSGESLWKIAQRYQIPLSQLKNSNPHVKATVLHVGERLYIPFETSATWNMESPQFRSHYASREPNSTRFSWPIEGGRLSSHFGWRRRRRHVGIDIAAPMGTSVRAARSGHVIYSGSRIGGYGRMIIIRHLDRFATVYAHLSRILVKAGQYVSRGKLIGRVGSTGRSTGPHLHFEVREDRKPVNPLLYLQSR